MMGLLKEKEVRHEENSQARGTWRQQRAQAERKRVERHCEVGGLTHRCVFCHDRQNPTIDSQTTLAMTGWRNYGVVGLVRRFVLRNNNRMEKNEKALTTRERRCEGWEEKRGSEKGRF
jgi:hypothetical protein